MTSEISDKKISQTKGEVEQLPDQDRTKMKMSDVPEDEYKCAGYIKRLFNMANMVMVNKGSVRLEVEHNINQFTITPTKKRGYLLMYNLMIKSAKHRTVLLGTKGGKRKRRIIKKQHILVTDEYFKDNHTKKICHYQHMIDLIPYTVRIFDEESWKTNKKTNVHEQRIAYRLMFNQTMNDVKSIYFKIKNPKLVCQAFWKAMSERGIYSNFYDDGIEVVPLPDPDTFEYIEEEDI